MGNAVYVFQKKSRSGIATRQPCVELIEKQMKCGARPYWGKWEFVMKRNDQLQDTYNALADLGFADAEGLLAKTDVIS